MNVFHGATPLSNLLFFISFSFFVSFPQIEQNPLSYMKFQNFFPVKWTIFLFNFPKFRESKYVNESGEEPFFGKVQNFTIYGLI